MLRILRVILIPKLRTNSFTLRNCLLGLAKICRAGSPVSLSAAGPRWRLAHFSSTVSYISCRQVGERAVRLLKMAGDLRLMYVSERTSVG
jgi:hypothetical protein